MRLPDQEEVAESRVRFLTADTDAPRAVRDPILASWQRSHEFHVAADNIRLPYLGDPEQDTWFSRSAAPVLRTLSEQLKGQSVSVILTDQSGLVLERLTGDGDLERHLDQVLLAPGFSYSEEFVGTNGIGTALEMGGPAHVFGHEHYAEHLEDLACAGVPIHHPISGRLVGAVDLTCWRKDAGALLLTLAKTTAEQIRQAMLANAGASQIALFQEYLRTCHRRSDVVFALSNDVVMLNDHARTLLDPADQATLLAQATEASSSPVAGRDSVFDVELSSGRSVRLHCRPVGAGDRPDGVVAHLSLDPESPRSRTRVPAPRMSLPGLVGTAPVWRHACEEVERALRSGDWVALEGEPGVGKTALLRAVQLRRQPVGRLTELDAASAATVPGWLAGVRDAANDADVLVLRHVDDLRPALLRGVLSALHAASGPRAGRGPLWVAMTMRAAPDVGDLQDLLRLFPTTVEVPPLRLHLEDLQLLVPFFLARLGRGGNLVCSHEAMRLLMRMAWPGNVGQVHELLRDIVRHRRTGSIAPEDLPPEAHTVSRRVLTSLESMERDAIVRSLADAHGNKARAAQALGMSRATIYRKIHDYGIVAPAR
ncbi:sigma-54-dependent Fis family transcriptional regulator [Nocardioides donggukensis]|uniref:sigma-54-dependent Fis family transcriptional regulator n=1 Tax=Nocardioides donggukensis TaxID=2774019 RepID=UPI00191DED83|nr:GAF domain-containing protein [Nocardioides donggukensis]